jgi:hypothetical protein
LVRRLVAIFLIAVACTPEPLLPPPSLSTPPSSSPTEAVVVTPSPDPATLGAYGRPRVNALGPLHGDWVFALRETQDPVLANVYVELLAMPLTGSTPRLAMSWVQPSGGINVPLPNGIASQLSPDGKRLVVGLEGGTRGGQLFVADLETGAFRSIGEGILPVWGSGERIAFQRRHPTEVYGPSTSWFVDAAGGAPTRIVDDATPLVWHRDSLVVGVRGGIEIRGPADYRPGMPFPLIVDNVPVGERPIGQLTQSGVTVLAIATYDAGRTPAEHKIEVVSTPGAGSRETVASEVGSYVEVRFAEPHWSPADVLQILYRRDGSRGHELHIFDMETKRDTVATVKGIPRRAEWTPDGEQIVYLTDQRPAEFPAREVRSIRPISGRDDRLLIAAEPNVQWTFRDVATFRYPP